MDLLKSCPIFITAFLGVFYARYEGFNTLRAGMSQIIKNELPIYEIFSGAALAFAALLLIIPGFATDAMGLLIIFPPTRKLLFKTLIKKLLFSLLIWKFTLSKMTSVIVKFFDEKYTNI